MTTTHLTLPALLAPSFQKDFTLDLGLARDQRPKLEQTLGG